MEDRNLTCRKIEARGVLLPLNRPIVSKVGIYDEWPMILIDLHTREGIIGRSYLEPYITQSVPAIMSMLDEMEKLLAGKLLSPVDNHRQNMDAFHLVGREGMTMIAASGLDMAIWDALAKSADMPLAVYLGGSLGPVPAYNSNGLWLIPPDTLGAEAQELVDEGDFSGLKVRLGRTRLSEDLTALSVIRSAVGDEVKLMCDFNQGLDFNQALHLCHALDDQDLYWFEEPVVYNNLTGVAQLVKQLKTPVSIGENFYGPRCLYQAIQQQACDLVMPDLMRIGGVTGWLRAAALAGAAGIPVSTHLYPEVAAHLMRVTETAHWLEWQDWAAPILAEPFELRKGCLVIPEKPGSGVAWDEAAVKRYQIR